MFIFKFFQMPAVRGFMISLVTVASLGGFLNSSVASDRPDMPALDKDNWPQAVHFSFRTLSDEVNKELAQQQLTLRDYQEQAFWDAWKSAMIFNDTARFKTTFFSSLDSKKIYDKNMKRQLLTGPQIYTIKKAFERLAQQEHGG